MVKATRTWKTPEELTHGPQEFREWLQRQLALLNTYPSRLAKQLGVSHPTVGRWLTGEDQPKTFACWRLAELTGEPLLSVMKLAGHLPKDFEYDPMYELPALREYLAVKYPGKLFDPLVAMLERELARES